MISNAVLGHCGAALEVRLKGGRGRGLRLKYRLEGQGTVFIYFRLMPSLLLHFLFLLTGRSSCCSLALESTRASPSF